MSPLRVVLLVVLLLLLVGALPVWPHATAWGYWPSGGFGVVIIFILVLILVGVL